MFKNNTENLVGNQISLQRLNTMMIAAFKECFEVYA